MKIILNSIKILVKDILHICLIPVVAVLKAINAGVLHLITELSAL